MRFLHVFLVKHLVAQRRGSVPVQALPRQTLTDLPRATAFAAARVISQIATDDTRRCE